MTPSKTSLVALRAISRKRHIIRGNRVLLDSDLAELYGVPTKRPNEQVRRNKDRFPKDFMFELTKKEAHILRSQFATSKPSAGGRRYLPYVFTEQGVAMLLSVLNSDRAIRVNIAIMRAFVQLRQILATHHELAKKLDELEKKYDKRFQIVFEVLNKLIEPPPIKSNPIGFSMNKPHNTTLR